MSSFQDPIAGSLGDLLIEQVQSPNFVHDVSGWQVAKDGSAEFNNLTVRGTFNGTDYVINSTGIFLYSGTPAAGNLVNSITNFGGTDSFGNKYLIGSVSYSNAGGQAIANVDGVLFFYTGSLAGGWTQQGSLQADTSTSDQIDLTGSFLISGSLIIQGTGLTVNGTNIIAALSGQPTTSTAAGAVTGTSATAGLASGVINGTSGAQSAGTAHTHGAGSYAVANGQHSHGAGSYDVSGTHNHDLPTI